MYWSLNLKLSNIRSFIPLRFISKKVRRILDWIFLIIVHFHLTFTDCRKRYSKSPREAEIVSTTGAWFEQSFGWKIRGFSRTFSKTILSFSRLKLFSNQQTMENSINIHVRWNQAFQQCTANVHQSQCNAHIRHNLSRSGQLLSLLRLN